METCLFSRAPSLTSPPSITQTKHSSQFIKSTPKLLQIQKQTRLSATLNSPKGFGPSPKKPKKTQKPKKGYDNEEEDEKEEEVEEGVIPEIVTNRMISRMGFSVGIPLFIGLLFFPFFYYLKVGLKVDVPSWVPVIVSFVFQLGSNEGRLTLGLDRG